MQYAIVVPILVVMSESAWTVQSWHFRNTLLNNVFSFSGLVLITVVALISFFVIRPFAIGRTARTVAFLVCVLGFTVLLVLFLPKLAE